MIRTLLVLAAGIGVGAGAMNAAHRHEDGEGALAAALLVLLVPLVHHLRRLGSPPAHRMIDVPNGWLCRLLSGRHTAITTCGPLAR